MQAYTASGPYLTRMEISGLDGKRIPAALYMSDADMNHWPKSEVQVWSRNYLSIPVDGIPNFTRTPEVWFWMVRHYRSAEQLMPGVLGLQRDDLRAARISMQSRSLGLPAKTYAIAERDSATNIGTPDWPAGFDFIRLRVNVHYPIWWKLRKPERLQLEITRADGSRDIQWVVLPPNVSTDIWFYPWDATDRWPRTSTPTPRSGVLIRGRRSPACACSIRRWTGCRSSRRRSPSRRRTRSSWSWLRNEIKSHSRPSWLAYVKMLAVPDFMNM